MTAARNERLKPIRVLGCLLTTLGGVCLIARHVQPHRLLAANEYAVYPAAAPRLPQKDEQAKKSAREGVYSAAQAERGASIYNARCGSCHVVEQFAGPTFMQSWRGQTADALFDLIRNTMPTENPGGLKRQEYADVLAYIFKVNGLPAGETELKGAQDALKRVVIEAGRQSRAGSTRVRVPVRNPPAKGEP